MTAAIAGSPFWSGMTRSRGRHGTETPEIDRQFTTSPTVQGNPPPRPDNAPIKHLPPGAAQGSVEMSRIKTPRSESLESHARYLRDR